MSVKDRILHVLGENSIIFPDIVNDALSANDKLKYLFTLLQMAKSKANNPPVDVSNMRSEREICGIEEAVLDQVVEGSRVVGDDSYFIPEANNIYKMILSETHVMLSPLEFIKDSCKYDNYAERLNNILAILDVHFEKAQDKNIISDGFVDKITSGDSKKIDSLHLFVMDLHKELNAILSSLSLESIDGAKVFAVNTDDAAFIKSFMSGINKTAKLKFDHPGLGTTVTRAGEKLIIQNDIGTTDSHVLVIHVVGLAVSIIYTDVHINRLRFFQRLLDKYDIAWDETFSKVDRKLEDSIFHMITGKFAAENLSTLNEFLEYLGSKLVFMIDWNRARKRIQRFLSKTKSIDLLKWSSDNNIGHMAFLMLGGEKIIHEVLGFSTTNVERMTGKLDGMLGEEKAYKFLQFILKITLEGLLKGRSRAIIIDEIRAEFVTYMEHTEDILLGIVSELSSYILDISSSIRDNLLSVNTPYFISNVHRNAEMAKVLEKKADDLVNKVRHIVERDSTNIFYEKLIVRMDDIVDFLEDAAFHLALQMDNYIFIDAYPYMQKLAQSIVKASLECIKLIEIMKDIREECTRGDISDFLVSIDNIREIEQQTDVEEREIKKILVSKCKSIQGCYPLLEASEKLERAGDAFMYMAEMLRTHMMGKYI